MSSKRQRLIFSLYLKMKSNYVTLVLKCAESLFPVGFSTGESLKLIKLWKFWIEFNRSNLLFFHLISLIEFKVRLYFFSLNLCLNMNELFSCCFTKTLKTLIDQFILPKKLSWIYVINFWFSLQIFVLYQIKAVSGNTQVNFTVV